MEVRQVLSRCHVEDLDSAITFYEELLRTPCGLRFRHAGLELAQVGSILLLAGPEDALRPFRETQATFLVDSVMAFRERLLERGATLIRDVANVPTGMNMTVRHPDGAIVEYVEFTHR